MNVAVMKIVVVYKGSESDAPFEEIDGVRYSVTKPMPVPPPSDTVGLVPSRVQMDSQAHLSLEFRAG